jgi:hypothetical protein
MCTATFMPGRGGFRVAMNRDEQRARVAALPPAVHAVDGLRVIHPVEPSGGTWISVNTAGTVFALVNWYSVPFAAGAGAVSRGEVVRTLRGGKDPASAESIIRALPLGRFPPFRAIGIFAPGCVVREWRWDGSSLDVAHHDWSPGQWISSGHDESGAQRVRGRVFAAWHAAGRADRGDGLKLLHASHDPAEGPYSTCMHRADAETVSATFVEVDAGRVAMAYVPGPPCRTAPGASILLPRD